MLLTSFVKFDIFEAVRLCSWEPSPLKEELITTSSALISSLKVAWALIVRVSVNKSPITVSPAIDRLPGMFIPAELDISLFLLLFLPLFTYTYTFIYR